MSTSTVDMPTLTDDEDVVDDDDAIDDGVEHFTVAAVGARHADPAELILVDSGAQTSVCPERWRSSLGLFPGRRYKISGAGGQNLQYLGCRRCPLITSPWNTMLTI